MKSIKSKILINMILTIAISLTAVGVMGCYLNYKSTADTLRQSMQQTVTLAGERVHYQIQAYENIAMDTGRIARLSDPTKTIEDRQEIINQAVEAYGLRRGNLLDTNGKSLIDGNDYSDREYVQQALKGNAYISQPLVSKITGELSMMVAAPIWKGGVPNSTVVGVVYFVPPEDFLNDIVSSISISDNSQAYLLNNEGTTIADADTQKVKDKYNCIAQSQSDASLVPLAEIHKHMITAEPGFATYKQGRATQYIAYTPIPELSDWTLAITAPEMDFMRETIIGVILTLVLLAVTCVISAVIALRLANGIGKPIKSCAERIEKLSEGDLKSEVPQVSTRDETHILAAATQKIVSNMNSMIGDLSWGMGRIAEGDFTVDSQCGDLYAGDFHPMHEAMYKMISRLTNVLREINLSSDQVAQGSNQVSAGAQALSQGATEQAAAVEELSATIEVIARHVETNAEHAQHTSEVANRVGENISASNEEMTRLLDAMGDINGRSREIGKIIKTIEDIAFQTNILALNAAVEAARAGAAGKGFAVVADEVRNLANKSQEASKNTAELIRQSMEAVENGTQLADHTAKGMRQAVEGARQVMETIDRISEASQEQAESISQVTEGVDQISSVVQTNSATAEQSAAASEELSSQAQMLRELVEGFKLKD